VDVAYEGTVITHNEQMTAAGMIEVTPVDQAYSLFFPLSHSTLRKDFLHNKEIILPEILRTVEIKFAVFLHNVEDETLPVSKRVIERPC
jgi:hypothetical protein